MSTLLIPDKNILLGYCNSIQEICSPLQQLGITYFNYVKIYNDGSRIDLSSHADLTEYYYFKNKAYENHAYETDPSGLQSGFSLWKNSIADDPTVQVLREEFDTDNGATLIERTEECCEIYYFASTRENTQILDFYFNHFNTLKLFIYYFKDQAAKIIKKAELNKIIIAENKNGKSANLFNTETNLTKIDGFLNQLNIKRFYLGNPYYCYLTKREVECLNWCIRGKSAEEIAIIIGCSTHTAITHLENLKRKLKCSKQIQLAKAAYELGLNINY